MNKIPAQRSLEDDMCSQAFRTIHLVLDENKGGHPNNPWRLQTAEEHVKHALLHCADFLQGHKVEDLTGALTRLAMANFLYQEEQEAFTIKEE